MKNTLRSGPGHAMEGFSGLKLKIAMLLLLITCLQVAQVQADTTKAETFTLEFQAAMLKDVLSSIEGKTSYRFFYNHKAVDVNRRIDVSLDDVLIQNALANYSEILM